jgi:hypothetical protein
MSSRHAGSSRKLSIGNSGALGRPRLFSTTVFGSDMLGVLQQTPWTSNLQHSQEGSQIQQMQLAQGTSSSCITNIDRATAVRFLVLQHAGARFLPVYPTGALPHGRWHTARGRISEKSKSRHILSATPQLRPVPSVPRPWHSGTADGTRRFD